MLQPKFGADARVGHKVFLSGWLEDTILVIIEVALHHLCGGFPSITLFPPEEPRRPDPPVRASSLFIP